MKTFYGDIDNYAEVEPPIGILNSCWITGMFVDKSSRRQGTGTALLKQVCQDADDDNLMLCLVAMPIDDGMTLTTLVAWYEKQGFRRTYPTVPLGEFSCEMYRKPERKSEPCVRSSTTDIYRELYLPTPRSVQDAMQ